MEQIKYMSVVRLGHKNTVGVLNEGDKIVIQEKLDGSNASFTKYEDYIKAFSRNLELTSENTLNGFFQFATLRESNELNDDYIYYGEWLVPHKVKYEGHEKQFFLFDIYSKSENKYLPFEIVKKEALRLNLNLIPIFYEGDYISFEHLNEFVGKTKLNGKIGDKQSGEGIVVKNISYQDKLGKQLFVKLVTDEFREIQSQKKAKDPNFKNSNEYKMAFQFTTKARIEKLIVKYLIDKFDRTELVESDKSFIFKSIPELCINDILKEEFDYVQSLEKELFYKHVKSNSLIYIREILKEKGII